MISMKNGKWKQDRDQWIYGVPEHSISKNPFHYPNCSKLVSHMVI